MSNEVDRQVETRPPLDSEKILREAMEDIEEMARFRVPTEEQGRAVLSVVAAGQIMIEKIIAAIPEGTEQIVAVNNVKAAVLWARHGVLRRSVAVLAPCP